MTGKSVDAVAGLPLDEGLQVLRGLTARMVGTGNPIVGWKIARLPGAEHSPFVGPVFASSLTPGCLTRAVRSRVEVEFVARLERPLGSGPFETTSFSWFVGLEFIDNHDPDWDLALGWAAADWGLQVGAVVGDPCGPPTFERQVVVELELPAARSMEGGAWQIGPDVLVELLRRDCPRIARPCQVGDLVWTGALVAPVPLTSSTWIRATVDGSATVSFERT
jgi:2-keto-4-pentenoate hydratase